MDEATWSGADIRELVREIAGLREELRRFSEWADRRQAVLPGDPKEREDAGPRSRAEGTGGDLEAVMVRECPMRERCYAAFLEFLEAASRRMQNGEASDEIVGSFRVRLVEMRRSGPFRRCDTCFTGVRRLFEKQVDLMRSVGIYRTVREGDGGGPVIPDEAVVEEILEPVANSQRFRIMVSLMTQARTFSELSQETGLRGGNLAFHIRKLADSGMLLQRSERGDYVITDRGNRTMTAVARLHRVLNPD